MPLVGDIIMDVRRRVPDMPGVGTPPTIVLAPATVAGGLLTTGVPYYVVGTYTNPWGESAPTAEQTITLTGGQNAIQVTFTFILDGDDARAYFGPTPAGESAFFQPIGGGVGPIIIGAPTGNQTVPSVPPIRSTAFRPDSDGSLIGAGSIYQLLARALAEMIRIAGGIVDVTGVQSTINQALYRLDAPFYQFTNAWFDGYPMAVVQRSMMYLRNSVAGFSGVLSYEQDGPQSVIQVWPQSNRTGGQSTITADMAATDTSFTVTNASSFPLSIGLMKIDSEVMAFSQLNGATFQGVMRGLSGTDPTAHSAGATATELNIRMSGRRMCRAYNSGDSQLNIEVPQAWETPLVLHMLSQVRSIEQDDAAAEKLLSDFQAQADKIGKQSRLGQIRPRQIPIWGQQTSDARNINGSGFGWLIN